MIYYNIMPVYHGAGLLGGTPCVLISFRYHAQAHTILRCICLHHAWM